MYDRNLWRSWIRRSALILGTTVLSMMTWHPAWAQLDTEHKTVVSFTTPVEVPGSDPQVLPAGSYTFKVIDSKANPNIVQVSNKEETHVYTTILAIPTHRDVDTDKTVMTFEERAAGEPQALRAWFYPHEKAGQEFVYSKDRATQLAKASNSPVPYSQSAAVSTAAAQPAREASPSPIMTVSPTGQSTPYTQQAQAIAQAPVTTQQPQAAPVETRPQTPQPVQTASNLPRTASNLPWIAIVGCLLLAGGISIKRLCER